MREAGPRKHGTPVIAFVEDPDGCAIAVHPAPGSQPETRGHVRGASQRHAREAGRERSRVTRFGHDQLAEMAHDPSTLEQARRILDQLVRLRKNIYHNAFGRLVWEHPLRLRGAAALTRCYLGLACREAFHGPRPFPLRR